MSDTLTYKAKGRYNLGWDASPFGSAPIKAEGQTVVYDEWGIPHSEYESDVEFNKEMDDGTIEGTSAEPTPCKDVG